MLVSRSGVGEADLLAGANRLVHTVKCKSRSQRHVHVCVSCSYPWSSSLLHGHTGLTSLSIHFEAGYTPHLPTTSLLSVRLTGENVEARHGMDRLELRLEALAADRDTNKGTVANHAVLF